MKTIIHISIFLLLSIEISAQKINMQIWNLNYRIQVLDHDFKEGDSISRVNSGTAFAVRYLGNIYLVTAKHLFPGYKSGDDAHIRMQRGSSINIGVLKVYFPSNFGGPDVAVAPLDTSYFFIDISKTTAKSEVGQSIIYMGFPQTDIGGHISDLYTTSKPGEIFPILKRGFIAGYRNDGQSPTELIIDSQAIPGFSGGPVMTYVDDVKAYQLIGILTGGFLDNARLISDKGENKKHDNIAFQTALSFALDYRYIIETIEINGLQKE